MSDMVVKRETYEAAVNELLKQALDHATNKAGQFEVVMTYTQHAEHLTELYIRLRRPPEPDAPPIQEREAS